VEVVLEVRIVIRPVGVRQMCGVRAH
jgi:hypothetical protein